MEGYTTLTSPSSCQVLTIFILLPFMISQNIQSVASTTTTTTTNSDTTPQPYINFIRTSCSNTTYPSLCYQTLYPYATSVQTNPWKLCNVALTATLKSARATSNLVSKLARQKGMNSKDAVVIKDCIDNIGDSVGELKQSLKALGKLGQSADKKFQMANIKTWLSAAITDEYTCTDGFAGRKVSADVKNKITNAISSFTRLTSNALSLINHLNS